VIIEITLSTGSSSENNESNPRFSIFDSEVEGILGRLIGLIVSVEDADSGEVGLLHKSCTLEFKFSRLGEVKTGDLIRLSSGGKVETMFL